ncbi:hypothetical protein V1520DRAFT_311223, partial [Lipomyces starkeyi]
SQDYANIKHRGTLTTRGWDGALRYLDNDEYALIIVVAVGVTQYHSRLRSAILYLICARTSRVRKRTCATHPVL